MLGKLVNCIRYNVIDTLTIFLKCNYKYKRRVDKRNDYDLLLLFKVLNGAPMCCSCCHHFTSYASHMHPKDGGNGDEDGDGCDYVRNKTSSSSEIMWHVDVDATNDDVNSLETHQGNYDKVPTPLAAIDILHTLSSQQLVAREQFYFTCCEEPAWQHSPTITSTTTTTTATTTTTSSEASAAAATNLSVSQVPRQILSLVTTLSMSTRRLSYNWTAKANQSSRKRVNLLSILMTLFIALVLSPRAVQAGACWQSVMDNDKCSEIYSLNMSRSDCCGKHPDFSYTAHDPSTVEYFFATTVGDGMACAPCVENCKHMTCGPNKKCLKRKGRTKCICAPECGAAARNKERLIKQQKRHNIGGTKGEGEREIRSLSSEITHINLELDVVHQSQRNVLQMQSQRSQKPYSSGGDKPKRLIIASDVDEKTEKPTTRRLQIFSNVDRHVGAGRGHGHGRGGGSKNRKNHDHRKTISVSANDVNTTERQDKLHKRRKQRNRNKNKQTNNHHTSNYDITTSQHSSQPKTIKTETSSAANYESAAAAHVNDLSMLDDVYAKYNLHGFPNTKPALSHFEHFHSTKPVCGTDGRTYNSECQLKKRACRTDNSRLAVAYRGYCRTTCNGVKCLNGLKCVEDHYTIPHCIACEIDCSADDGDDYDNIASNSMMSNYAVERAVCGVDGKTYKSICHINRMICEIGRSIAVAYPGPCRGNRITCADINCGAKQTCLLDLLTQEPRCVSCSYKCSRKHRPNTSRYEEGKICGNNNRTYNSWCEMRKDSCATGYFIDIKTPGECK